MRVEQDERAEGVLPVWGMLAESAMVRRAPIFTDHKAIPHGDPVEHSERPPGFIETRLDQHSACPFSDSAIRLLCARRMAPRDRREVSQWPLSLYRPCRRTKLRRTVAPPSSDFGRNVVEPMNEFEYGLLSFEVRGESPQETC